MFGIQNRKVDLMDDLYIDIIQEENEKKRKEMITILVYCSLNKFYIKPTILTYTWCEIYNNLEYKIISKNV